MMGRTLILALSTFLVACASAPGRAPASDSNNEPEDRSRSQEPARMQDLQVFYGEPKLQYKKVCRIEAEGSNALERKFTKKADFEGQFKRRARRCPGANAVIIESMFAFENGSAFADGSAIRIEP